MRQNHRYRRGRLSAEALYRVEWVLSVAGEYRHRIDIAEQTLSASVLAGSPEEASLFLEARLAYCDLGLHVC